MNWRIFKIIILTYILALAIWTPPALADTTYTEVAIPTVRDGNFESMGRITITGTSTQTFTGNNDRAEFRLPPGFYITSTVVGSVYGQDAGVVLKPGIGLDNPSAIEINPISQDPYNPDHFRGFEIIIKTKSGGDGNKPEFTLYFDRVFVPRGYSGAVQVTVEKTETSGFTSGTFRVAQVAAAQLTLSVENSPSLTADKKLGPILITENMPGAFDYIELSLPAGFEWEGTTAHTDPGLGLIRDYDGDGSPERDYEISSTKNKYGRSVLRAERSGLRSTTTGTLRIECYVNDNDGAASYGDVNVTVEGSADPSVTTLKVGSYDELKVSITATQALQLYGGLKEQDCSDLTITENAPGTLLGGQKTVSLELPSWANWAQEPTVQVEGVTELELATNSGRAFAGNDGTVMRFYITTPSLYQVGKITVKDIKISPAVDATGPLKIKVSGTAGAIGEVDVGTVNPPLTATSLSTPALLPGLQEQKAGDIELKEAAGTVLLAHELWVDFPSTISLVGTPTVTVSAGDLRINMPTVAKIASGKTRLTIPVNTSSTTACTLQITGITYDISGLVPDGDITVTVSGPAVNEVNGSEPPLFPNNNEVARVANAIIGTPPPIVEPVVPAPVTRNVTFKIDENSYQVNGQTFDMDVAPYILDSRTFLPIRYAGLALGIEPENILWDGTNRTVTLFKEDLMVQVKVGEYAIYRSGLKITADAAAHIKDERLMVPLRALATAFRAKVDWEAETRTVNLTL